MNEFKRLHPASIILLFLQGMRGILLPLIITLFFSNRSEEQFFRFEYIWLGFIIILFVSSLLSYISFRYHLHDGELFVQKGILIKKKRYIQQSRVQSIDMTAGIIQRIFGLVKLTVETAGSGGEPEVQLNAIKKSEAKVISEALKRNTPPIFRVEEQQVEYGKFTHEDKPYSEPQQEKTWILSTKHLVVAALTSSGIGLTISMVGALFSQFEQVIPESIYERTFGFFVGSGMWFVLAIIVFVFIVSWIISIINTILKYGKFSVEKHGDELIIKRGLLETRQLTIKQHRITAVRFVSNIFRQPFGYTTVYVESAGGGTGEEQGSTVFLPLIKKREVETILAEFIPEYAKPYTLHSVPKRAAMRYLRRNALIPVTATALAFYFYPDIAFYGLFLIGMMLVIGYGQYHDAASGSYEDTIYLRYRKLSQVIVVAKHNKIQSIERQVNYFQERKDLASLKFAVQSSFSWKTFQVDDVDLTKANDQLYWYSRKNQHKSS
ncbi:PH domain-containing protein [Alkalihalophilus sp. As8PL]|uniref:PH domain-containing protein n=1 Tax=Alkalihalophilus sp. As8PL TaxID=3237103 RepID=A0AB39BTI2_9BACI